MGGKKLANTGVVRITTPNRNNTSECTQVMSQLVVKKSGNNCKVFVGKDT